MSENDHASIGRRSSDELIEYRLEQVELQIKGMRDGIHGLRNDLSPVLMLKSDVAKLQDRFKITEDGAKALNDRCAVVEGQYKRWLHIGYGVAITATTLGALLWGLTIHHITQKITKYDAVMEVIPGISANMSRQAHIQRAILKKLGIEMDFMQ